MLSSPSRPRRLGWPRTPDFQSGNTGSNPVGDTIVVDNGAGEEPCVGPGRAEPVPDLAIDLNGFAAEPPTVEQLPDHLPDLRRVPVEQRDRLCGDALNLPRHRGRVERGDR